MLSGEIQCCSSIFVRKPRYGRVQQWVQLAESKQKIGLIVWWARFLFVSSQAETLTRLSSIMYNQIREDTLYIMLYAAVTVIAWNIIDK